MNFLSQNKSVVLLGRGSSFLLRSSSGSFRKTYSTGTPSPAQAPKPIPPRSPPKQDTSKVLPTALLLVGGGGAALAGYYYVDPNADIFKYAKSMLGMAGDEEKQPKGRVGVLKSNAVAEEKAKQQKRAAATSSPPPTQQQASSSSVQVPAPPKPAPPPQQQLIPAQATTAASAMNSSGSAASSPPKQEQVEQRKREEVEIPAGPDFVPKNVLVTALRAQQEALSESHDAKIKTIQSEYDRRLGNATQVIEAERVVELRGKYEKASAALQAIEKGIEARTTQNERAKRLRSLWAMVNALHARVNHPEYHSSTVTQIDKSALLRSAQVLDKFVAQMIDSLPAKPVHSLESLKSRFYNDVAPVAKSVGLIKEGEGFSLWKYFVGRVFSGGVMEVVHTEGKKSSSSNPVHSTTEALDAARHSLDKGDLLSAAIAINHLSGLPRQVATDWLADARTLLETNQTLFVLMTYAASNNVF